MWGRVLERLADTTLPQFNSKLITEFRGSKISQMANYLDSHFTTTIGLFHGKLKYEGFAILSPLEAAKWKILNSINNGKVKVNRSTMMVVQYKFDMEGMKYYIYQMLPFVTDGYILIDDVKYFPFFTIVERLVHRHESHVVIKPSGSPLLFYRDKRMRIVSVDNRMFHEHSISALIHCGINRRGPREYPPIYLYHLVEHGFVKTLKLYGIDPKEFSLVSECKMEQDYTYFRLRHDIHVRVRDDLLKNMNIIRFLIGIHRMFNMWKHYTLQDVYSPSGTIFKVILGKYTNRSCNDPINLRKYTESHLDAYNCMFDPTTRINWHRAGYTSCNTMSDLLLIVINEIDKWLIQHPTDLYNKKIGSLEAAASSLIEVINKAQYSSVQASTREIRHENIRTFVNHVTNKNPNRYKEVCRPNPTIIHNNYLITFGVKSTRTLQTETSSIARGGSVAEPMALLVSHPSHLVVESLLSYPSQDPIKSSTLNPYLMVDDDGNIIKPAWADELSDVYDNF